MEKAAGVAAADAARSSLAREKTAATAARDAATRSHAASIEASESRAAAAVAAARALASREAAAARDAAAARAGVAAARDLCDELKRTAAVALAVTARLLARRGVADRTLSDALAPALNLSTDERAAAEQGAAAIEAALIGKQQGMEALERRRRGEARRSGGGERGSHAAAAPGVVTTNVPPPPPPLSRASRTRPPRVIGAPHEAGWEAAVRSLEQRAKAQAARAATLSPPHDDRRRGVEGRRDGTAALLSRAV